MEDWPNVLSPTFSPAQMIVFTEKGHTSFKWTPPSFNWTPPTITVIPIDLEALSKSSFDITNIAEIPEFKEKEDRRGFQWVVAGLKCADDGAVLLIVKVVHSG
ncbi:hypothetical protein TWF102_000157 [Orbilia oligospora]|uniref:Uncharacterized protein n=1 Tax=Orbilia oligospora TaxID=2813651 RepID=A0A7C8JND1_ORBOL|nr:hypothetical protein TWF706_004617 [Orbilia oligospora]KAF3113498.1 hypothetical protein TWF102_000157 [Orbilia oligospora]KAF3129061.1 hypothetical protein TWF703_009091 [Orbilia oligospora]KAF3150428.1 hypothetical protein TWF594_009072 [Orbilia oligospora]